MRALVALVLAAGTVTGTAYFSRPTSADPTGQPAAPPVVQAPGPLQGGGFGPDPVPDPPISPTLNVTIQAWAVGGGPIGTVSFSITYNPATSCWQGSTTVGGVPVNYRYWCTVKPGQAVSHDSHQFALECPGRLGGTSTYLRTGRVPFFLGTSTYVIDPGPGPDLVLTHTVTG